MQFRGTPDQGERSTGSELTVEALADGFSLPVRVGVGEDVRELSAGERVHVHRRRRAGFA